MEAIDIEFNNWFNQAQPIEAIVKVVGPLPQQHMRNIRNQLKHAFTHGYARGVAAQVARPDESDPELGPIR